MPAKLVFDAPKRGKAPRHLADFDLAGRRDAVKELGLPAFRAAQLSKHHHRLGAGFNLGVEVKCHGVRIDFQNAVHQVRAAVHHGFDKPIVV